NAVEQWELHFQPSLLPEEAVRAGQESWEEPLFRQAEAQLLNSATTPVNRARVLACSRPEAGAWLQALPSPPLGTHLDNESFRIAVALRLGVQICQPHKCRLCGAQVNPDGLPARLELPAVSRS